MFRDLPSPRRRSALRRFTRVEALESRHLLDASYHSLATGPLTQNWSDLGQFTANDDWSGVPSIVGYLGDGVSLPDGTDPQIITSATLGTVAVLADQVNPDSGTGAGPAQFLLNDPTVALRGGGAGVSPASPAPSLVLFLDTSGAIGTHVAFDLRDIEGLGNAAEPFAVQYRTDVQGSFTNLPGGFVTDATTGPNLATLVTHVDVALPADADNQAHVQVRIVTTKAVGVDEWVGVDNIRVAATYTTPNVAPSISVPAGIQMSANHSPITFHDMPSAFVVFDPDAGGDPVQVSLTATHGVLSLSRLTNLNFNAGTGIDDSTMTFSGSITDLNRALDGLAFAPDSTYDGPATISVAVDDLGHNGTGGPGKSLATVSITVIPVNDPPVAVEDSATTDEDSPVRIFVTSNDTDIDSTLLTPTDLTKPSHGLVKVNADGSVTYTPDTDFNGTDFFQYDAFDGELASAPTTVTIFINPVNDPPVASGHTITLDENGSININFLQLVSDIDSDSLFVKVRGGPDHGALIPNADGTLNYTPDPHVNGTDTITFQASDNLAYSNLAALTILINPVNDPPKIFLPATHFPVNEGSTLDFRIGSTDIDGPSDAPHYSLGKDAPAGMTIDASTGVVSWTPADGPQALNVGFVVTDSGTPAFFDTGFIAIDVVNVAPVIAAIPSSRVILGASFTKTAAFADPGADSWTVIVDYGDGSNRNLLALNPDKTFSLNHVYKSPGQFRGMVAITDQDGGKATSPFTVVVNLPPPVIVSDARAMTSKHGFTTFTLAFSEAIDPKLATGSSHYVLSQAGRDKKYGTKDDVKIDLGKVTYDSMLHIVSFATKKKFSLSKTPIRLLATGLGDSFGQAVDGNRDGHAGGDSSSLFVVKPVPKPVVKPIKKPVAKPKTPKGPAHH